MGDYRLGKMLAKGRNAHVYRGQDLILARPVAVKISYAGSRSNGHDIIDEARAIALIDHPNVVRVYTAGWVEDCAFLAMEFIDGETLDDCIVRQGRLPWRRSLQLVEQVASGLVAMHVRGVLHGDLKPKNILLELGGSKASTRGAQAAAGSPARRVCRRAVIADLGIPRRWRKPGRYFGTPNYSSPEQCRYAKVIDEKSDIFSLGVMLYEMLSGALPFDSQGDESDVIFKNVVRGTCRPLVELAPSTPPAILRLVKRMMASSPQARPTAASVGRSVARILAGDAPRKRRGVPGASAGRAGARRSTGRRRTIPRRVA